MTTPASRPYRGGYLVGLLLAGVVAVRALLYYEGQTRLVALGLLGAFGALYLAEPRLGTHRWFRRTYFPVQIGLLIALSFLDPFLDMTAVLYIPLAPQVFRSFARWSAAGWVAILVVGVGLPLVADLGWAAGLALALTNIAGGAFLVSYDRLYRQARADQIESQSLLAELQAAHSKLQDYAAQAEELAAARERNRLARELHDSISQVMFGVTLVAQAARQLLDRDPARAVEQIDRLQEMTTDALAQLRSLIAELHPRPASPSVAGPTTPDPRSPSSA